MNELLTIGAVSLSLTAIIALARIIGGSYAKLVRMHDTLMGDGNGRKALRVLVEAHIEADNLLFREIREDLKQLRRDDEVRNTRLVSADAQRASELRTADTRRADALEQSDKIRELRRD